MVLPVHSYVKRLHLLYLQSNPPAWIEESDGDGGMNCLSRDISPRSFSRQFTIFCPLMDNLSRLRVMTRWCRIWNRTGPVLEIFLHCPSLELLLTSLLAVAVDRSLCKVVCTTSGNTQTGPAQPEYIRCRHRNIKGLRHTKMILPTLR